MFCSHFDCSNFDYKSPVKNKSGGQVVYVSTMPGSTDIKDRLRFQMSENENENRQSMVWGLSTPLAGQDVNRRTLELTIESPALLKFLQDLDTKNKKTAMQKSQEWWRKTLTAEDIDHRYIALVKPPYKEGAKHTVRVKVKMGEQTPTKIFVAVDEKNPDGSLAYSVGGTGDLEKNSQCLVVAESSGLWFMSHTFGMSLNATELLVWPNRRQEGMGAFSFSSSAKWQQAAATAAPSAHIGSPIIGQESFGGYPAHEADMHD
jgi:hypothetical protein